MEIFIITSDKKTKDALQEAGFELMSENCGVYTFFNDKEKMEVFESKSDLKLTYTNIIAI